VNAPSEANDVALLERLSQARRELTTQIAQRIVGQAHVVDDLVAALLAGGHVVLVGVPGLAKTLLVQTVSRALDLSYSRVQFTPDLMPSDINRAPPKTQAALLQAMQERTVTVAGRTYDLPKPFFVLATQNPIEQEGTYPLPEAQLDRFMFELRVGYPTREEEEQIVMSTTGDKEGLVKPVIGAEELLAMQKLVRRLPAPPSLVQYAVRLARSTRPDSAEATARVKKYVSWGAGPRASQYLVLGAKARAAMDGRAMPDLDDVRSVAPAVLRHRMVVNFQAEADGIPIEELIELPR
jgi:MoxR-like ATPase